MKLFSLAFVTLAFFWTAGLSNVVAATVPSFPACSSPQGSVKANYSQGTHGIVGNTGTYTGSDAVYTLSADTLTQCFCANNGQGIQTNWWKASSLTDADIQVLKNDGWFYVPNGALWGLDASPYMAKNNDYSCRGGIGGGDVAGAATGDILGLATTGDAVIVYSTFALGFGLIFLASLLQARRSREQSA